MDSEKLEMLALAFPLNERREAAAALAIAELGGFLRAFEVTVRIAGAREERLSGETLTRLWREGRENDPPGFPTFTLAVLDEAAALTVTMRRNT